MLSFEEIMNNKEIGKLIQYGYNLHRKDMGFSSKIPSCFLYNGKLCNVKEIISKNKKYSGIFGLDTYEDYSSSRVCTFLGIMMKNESAYMFGTNNENYQITFSILNSNGMYLIREDCSDGEFLTDEEEMKTFVEAMEFIGFKKSDIIQVINGTLLAEEAYLNVVANDIKNIRFVNFNGRCFEFEGNVAVKGNFDSINIDEFPFPFQEEPILDCSKVKTAWANFGENYNKVKLINVNKNRNSIKNTNLKNVIIDEPIDLSKVDVTGTKFGYQTIINLEHSITKLNEEQTRYITSINKLKQNDYLENSTDNLSNINQVSSIKIFANCNNNPMVEKTLYNTNADGIGLVRTEFIFNNSKDIENLYQILYYNDIAYYEKKLNEKNMNLKNNEEYNKNLEMLKELQKKQVESIIKNEINKPIIFKLLDLNIEKLTTNYGVSYHYDNTDYEEIWKEKNSNILKIQIEAIFDVLNNLETDINLLIPVFTTTYEEIYGIVNNLEKTKKEMRELSYKYNLKKLNIGVMIANKEMCSKSDELAKIFDFIIIDTSALAYSVSYSPELKETLTYIENTISKAREGKNNICIGICGEHTDYLENIDALSNFDINFITCSPAFVNSNIDYLKNKIGKEKNTKNIETLLKSEKIDSMANEYYKTENQTEDNYDAFYEDLEKTATLEELEKLENDFEELNYEDDLEKVIKIKNNIIQKIRNEITSTTLTFNELIEHEKRIKFSNSQNTFSELISLFIKKKKRFVEKINSIIRIITLINIINDWLMQYNYDFINIEENTEEINLLSLSIAELNILKKCKTEYLKQIIDKIILLDDIRIKNILKSISLLENNEFFINNQIDGFITGFNIEDSTDSKSKVKKVKKEGVDFL